MGMYMHVVISDRLARACALSLTDLLYFSLALVLLLFLSRSLLIYLFLAFSQTHTYTFFFSLSLSHTLSPPLSRLLDACDTFVSHLQ